MSIKSFTWEAFKDAPIVGVPALKLAGVSLSDWVFILGGIYAVARLAWFALECYWKWEDHQRGKSK